MPIGIPALRCVEYRAEKHVVAPWGVSGNLVERVAAAAHKPRPPLWRCGVAAVKVHSAEFEACGCGKMVVERYGMIEAGRNLLQKRLKSFGPGLWLAQVYAPVALAEKRLQHLGLAVEKMFFCDCNQPHVRILWRLWCVCLCRVLSCGVIRRIQPLLQ